MTIYLDNAASTAIDPEVVAAMLAQLRGDGANPGAAHAPGRAAAAAISQARAQVAELLGASPQEIVWTSSASEANNLAILGTAAYYQDAGERGGHMVTLATEHHSVLEPMRALEARGWRVTRLTVDSGGRIDPAAVAAALQANTRLVSVMHVNNETGVIQDLPAIGAVVGAHGAAFHVDAAQSAGRLTLDVAAFGADLLSLSAHKAHGPKGVGALYVRARPAARLSAILHGGGQEGGLRPGTPANHQVVGLGAALALAAEQREREQTCIAGLRDRLWTHLTRLSGVQRNGDALHCAPHILNVSFMGVHGEALLAGLAGGKPALAIAAGSACASAGASSSHVLRALGRSPGLAAASVRFSPGRFTSAADIDRAAQAVIAEVTRLRAMAPQGEAATA